MISEDELETLLHAKHNTCYYGGFRLEFSNKIVIITDTNCELTDDCDGFYFEYLNDKINWKQFPKNYKLMPKDLVKFANLKYKEFVKLKAFL